MAGRNDSDKNMLFTDLWYVLEFGSFDELDEKKACLFPVSKGKITDENQTTSIFLSTLSAVKKYREELLSQIGVKQIHIKNTQLHVYTEISYIDEEDGEKGRPDGLIVLTRGSKNAEIVWMAFVESKIGTNDIKTSQINKYMKYAKKIGVENIITISNQLVSIPTENTTSIPKTKLRNFKLFHWSWIYLSITAGRLLRPKTIKDSDHIYILKELRRYFKKHEGVKEYKSMQKKKWEIATKQFFDVDNKTSIETIDTIVKSYKQEEKNICLKLTDASDFYTIKMKTNRQSREEMLKKMLKKNGIISSNFYIAKNPSQFFKLDVNFIKKTLSCSTQYKIEKGKASAQMNKLIDILSKGTTIPKQISIRTMDEGSRSFGKFESLENLKLQKEKKGHYSIVNNIHKRIGKFEIKITNNDMGSRFNSAKYIVDDLETLVSKFFNKVFIRLK